MCEVKSRKNGQEQKQKNKKNTVVDSKKKSIVMSPIRRQMKKRNPFSGQNGQLVHWWLLIHSSQTLSGMNRCPGLTTWDSNTETHSRTRP